MAWRKDVRRRFEREILSLLEIANGDKEGERVSEMLKMARQIWKIRKTKGRSEASPTLEECRKLFRAQVAEAKTLLEAWMTAGRSYSSWKAQHSSVWNRVDETVSNTEYALVDPPDSEWPDEPEITRSYRLQTDAYGVIRYMGIFNVHWGFVDLVMNPLRGEVSVCDRCGRWFLNCSGHRNKRFCARRCAVLSSVTRSLKKRREEERQSKIRLAQENLKDWTPSRGDWKEWTAGDTGLSKKFLTRALNRGDLKPPAGV